MMGMGFGGIFGLVFIVVIVWAVIKVVANNNINDNTKLSSGNDALEILKRRYAKGEIDREEFEEMKKNLKK
jgi:putative membrane protein